MKRMYIFGFANASIFYVLYYWVNMVIGFFFKYDICMKLFWISIFLVYSIVNEYICYKYLRKLDYKYLIHIMLGILGAFLLAVVISMVFNRLLFHNLHIVIPVITRIMFWGDMNILKDFKYLLFIFVYTIIIFAVSKAINRMAERKLIN